jgi:NAD(P)-dependent dehydrogenase (short-subunit alcohol dehydrogenase family)
MRSLKSGFQFEVNTVGVIFTINAFLPLLKRGSTKKVITLGSAVGDVEFTLASKWVGHAPYSISKAAITMVNAKYAVEYQDEGFTFLTIAPGLVSTSTDPRELEFFHARPRYIMYTHAMSTSA